MNFRTVGRVFLQTIFTKVCKTNFTVQGCRVSFTKGTANNILATVLRLHSQESEVIFGNYNLQTIYQNIKQDTILSKLDGQQITIHISSFDTIFSSNEILFGKFFAFNFDFFALSQVDKYILKWSRQSNPLWQKFNGIS